MSMLITTTATLQGRLVLRYLGLVCGEATLALRRRRRGASALEDPERLAWVCEQEVQCARDAAIAGMRVQAEQLGANAIVAVDLDFERLDRGLLLICASGTAVLYEEATAVVVDAATQPGALSAWRALHLPSPPAVVQRRAIPLAPAGGRDSSYCRRRPPSVRQERADANPG
ncbi:MAG TPA: heavy metal-binding domain-containing protein [Dehalococcoidia bacterium]|nr:heavy metal-binding domain-containing protein [Dehalococcoidia bacterium]